VPDCVYVERIKCRYGESVPVTHTHRRGISQIPRENVSVGVRYSPILKGIFAAVKVALRRAPLRLGPALARLPKTTSKSAMSDRITALKLFTRAARVGNFSVAGRELGISQPSASRMIAALESDVGVTLFNRTTRAVMLTEAGALYLARVEGILTALLDADHEARGTGELRGVLRIGTTSSFGLREIIPRLARFIADHSSLKIELWANDHRHDLVTDSIDVAFRRGPLADSSALARKIFDVPRILAAAPAYFKVRGIPQTPEELIEHATIAGPEPYLPPLSYQKEGKAVEVKVESSLTVTLHEGVIASALAGLGIVATSSRSVKQELETGALVRILSNWDFGKIEIHAVFVNGRAIKPAARAFADFLAGELRD
jgi:DNA-binding transcriptional LysR family regulator